jgi:hypothetical protein
MQPIMSEQDAQQLAKKIERHPGWHAEAIPGWVGLRGWWYLRIYRDQDDDADGNHDFYVVRDQAGWELLRRGLALADRDPNT